MKGLRALILPGLLGALGCNFPQIHLVPAAPGPEAGPSARACQSLAGLEVCLTYQSWSYLGLFFQVEARNTGSEPLLVDPQAFECLAANPEGLQRTCQANIPSRAQRDDWECSYWNRDGLEKHTLGPGEHIQGWVCFPLDHYADAAFRDIKVLVRIEGRSFEFRFQPGAPPPSPH